MTIFAEIDLALCPRIALSRSASSIHSIRKLQNVLGMPATTRSSNKQAKLEDVGAGSTQSKKSASSKKRKSTEELKRAKKPTKKAKKDADQDDNEHDSEAVVINRAPVLELWASCVTHFLHPSLPWSTCLSAGAAISTITAISKGRSIGKMEKPDPGDAQEKRQKRKERDQKAGLEEIETMSFKLRLDKEGQAMVGDKPKKAAEEALKKKYGGPDTYKTVKTAFEEALQSWKGKEEELDQRAFGMYEDFRPSIPPGQKGWGRKGQMRLQTIKEVVSAG